MTLGIVAYVYHSRSRRLAAALAVPVLGAAVTAMLVGIDIDSVGSQGVEPFGHAPEPMPSIEWRRTSDRLLDDPQLLIMLDGGHEHEYVLHDLTVLVRLADGSQSRIPVSRETMALNSPASIAGTRVGGRANRNIVYLRVDAAQRQAISSPAAQITVEARIEVRRPRVAASLPLRAGATAAEDGSRWRIDRIDATDDRVTVTLIDSRVGRAVAGRSFNLDSNAPDYLLIDQTRSQVARLEAGGYSSNFGLVLPGPGSMVWTFRLRGSVASESPTFDLASPGSIDETRLAIVEWSSTGSYRISIDLPPRP